MLKRPNNLFSKASPHKHIRTIKYRQSLVYPDSSFNNRYFDHLCRILVYTKSGKQKIITFSLSLFLPKNVTQISFQTFFESNFINSYAVFQVSVGFLTNNIMTVKRYDEVLINVDQRR